MRRGNVETRLSRPSFRLSIGRRNALGFRQAQAEKGRPAAEGPLRDQSTVHRGHGDPGFPRWQIAARVLVGQNALRRGYGRNAFRVRRRPAGQDIPRRHDPPQRRRDTSKEGCGRLSDVRSGRRDRLIAEHQSAFRFRPEDPECEVDANRALAAAARSGFPFGRQDHALQQPPRRHQPRPPVRRLEYPGDRPAVAARKHPL